ncbi:VWA domain-containing protein [Lysinibacillus telephonicus]|uniref:VWA domain-containing protein n=1 Tax=Lysinibacillus telephonicus TaxID=1714840 RepID=UPI0037CF5C82
MNKCKKIVIVLLCCMLTFAWTAPLTTEAATITDVKSSNSKYTAVKWAVDNGIMETYPGGKFQTHKLVTEQQLLTMIANLDDNYSYSYSSDMIYNYYSELNIPLNSNRYANVSRGQFARIFAALNGLDLSEPQAVQYLYLNEITTGTTGKKTYNDYQPNKNITRGDIAVFFYRIAKQGGIASEGLTGTATGKDNSQITLPVNFMSNGTVEFENNNDNNHNDWSNNPKVNNEVQNIEITNPEITANGVDSTLITIDLKDSYGNEISEEESLQFKVTSKAGAKISSSSNSSSGQSIYAYSDGGELSVYVTAPKLTKTIKDTITFELVNNDEAKYASYKGKKFEATLRYVPKAELRITYDIYDPENPEYAGGNVDSGVKPTNLPDDMEPGKITIVEVDPDDQTFYGKQGSDSDKSIDYANAELRIANKEISPWLFEQIALINYNTTVQYSLNSEGRPVYNFHTEDVIKTDYKLSISSPVSEIVLFLIEFIPEDEEDISLYLYDSVKAIRAIYNSLSSFEQKNLQNNFKDAISKLEDAEAVVDSLKKNQDLANRPDGKEKYTKVIVSLVAPGGKIITDYRGKVRITYNGVSGDFEFTTNTKDYVTNTGHAGAAVAYFDSVIYGETEVTAELLPYDSEDNSYKKSLKDLYNQEVKETIFANQQFKENSCSHEVEVGFVVDQSGSMKKNDPTNHVSTKTKQLIETIDAKHNSAVRFNTKGILEKSGSAEAVSSADIFKASNIKGGTNIASGIDIALSNFTSSTTTSKSIILVSDGVTTERQINQVIQKAKNNNVKIYTVAVGKQADTKFSSLKQIADETGGQFFHISQIEKLHDVYENIAEAILCEDYDSDNFCTSPDSIFDDAEVEIRRTNVTMTATINTNCDNVDKVIAQFNSVYGNYQFDLIDRGQNIYRATQSVSKFQNFNLYEDVEFLAYDENGNLIGSKTVEIQ